MANYTLVPRQEEEADAEAEYEKKPSTAAASKNGGAPPPPPPPIGWTVEGVPVADPMAQRAQWETSIFSCLGKNDEFYSSDLEVCVLGSIAPCVLHGSNMERLGSVPGTFANHCLSYTGLYLLGSCLFGWNCIAPWFSYPNRTAIRHKFNLEGNCEGVAKYCGCSGSVLMDKAQREQCESTCDFGMHVFCHACALCQEAREVRRRLPHPGFTAKPVFMMLPPMGQTMARGA